jgi:signal transduction histidine kinase
MVETVLRNLITNSIKFSHHNNKIEIAGEKDELFYTIHVKDNGIGIPKESQENFFRIDKKVYSFGTDDEPGSGFGLILSKEFIESNGGSIAIKSEEGQGTEVSFSLPVFDADKISG